MDQQTRDKVTKLPLWARELIKRLESDREPLVQEAARCRKIADRANEEAKRYREANGALMELLARAGETGLDWANTVHKTLEGYEIYSCE